MVNRIIIPLDLEYSDARKMVDQFDPKICRLKIGKQLFTSAGPLAVKEFQSMGFGYSLLYISYIFETYLIQFSSGNTWLNVVSSFQDIPASRIPLSSSEFFNTLKCGFNGHNKPDIPIGKYCLWLTGSLYR